MKSPNRTCDITGRSEFFFYFGGSATLNERNRTFTLKLHELYHFANGTHPFCIKQINDNDPMIRF